LRPTGATPSVSISSSIYSIHAVSIVDCLTFYMISFSDTHLLQCWSLLFVQWEILWLEMICRLR
jgi:hypothetical protein